MYFRMLPGLILFPGLFLADRAQREHPGRRLARRAGPENGAQDLTPMTYSPLPAGDTSSAILAIRNLSVEVAGAGNRVVRNLSLDVHAGETVVRLASRSPRWPSWACCRRAS